jgi:hypothetical protein
MRRVGVGVRRRHDAGAEEAVDAALPLEQKKGEVRGFIPIQTKFKRIQIKFNLFQF